MLRRIAIAAPLILIPSISTAQAASAAKEILKKVSLDVLTNVLTTVATDAVKGAISKAQSASAPTATPAAQAATKKEILSTVFVAPSQADQLRAKLILEKIWNPNVRGSDKLSILYNRIDFMQSGLVESAALCSWLDREWVNTGSEKKAWATVNIFNLEVSEDGKLATVKYKLDYLFKLRDHYEFGPRNQLAVIANISSTPKIVALKPAGLAGFLWH